MLQRVAACCSVLQRVAACRLSISPATTISLESEVMYGVTLVSMLD